MRKQDSLFNRVCEFINTRKPGETYKSSELTNYCDGYENVTRYKTWNNNPFERTRKYQTMLKYSGIVTNVKRGLWEVNLNIPDWFTLAHCHVMCGYTHSTRSVWNGEKYQYYNQRRVNMTKEEIAYKLRFSQDLESCTEDACQANPVRALATAVQIANNSTYGAPGLHTLPSGIIITEDMKEEPNLAVKLEKIAPSDSEFYKSSDSHLHRDKLVNNLREAYGLLKAATIIMDEVQILDPLVQGRVVNIFEQLKSLTETVGNRIEYKHKSQNI